MKTPLISLLLAAVFALSFASNTEIETTQPEPCTVRAWVRAEDLSPDHISLGASHAVAGIISVSNMY
jgi:hypothetical protein